MRMPITRPNPWQEGQAPSGDGKKEDVIDAEFEVKK